MLLESIAHGPRERDEEKKRKEKENASEIQENPVSVPKDSSRHPINDSSVFFLSRVCCRTLRGAADLRRFDLEVAKLYDYWRKV